MMTNKEFLDNVLVSFSAFIKAGTSRSTAKLKPLHGAIANDIASMLKNKYTVEAQGFGDDKEGCIKGRYIDKKVDITISNKKTGKAIAGIAVKFVMQNYSQNSNNYFENMLGETANIRSANIPYFQVFIILNKIPYYNKDGVRTKWENFSEHNLLKYDKLSEDNIEYYFHTPNKTLIYVVDIKPETDDEILSKKDYLKFYQTRRKSLSIKAVKPKNHFKAEGTILLNDYKTFLEKVYHSILAQ